MLSKLRLSSCFDFQKKIKKCKVSCKNICNFLCIKHLAYFVGNKAKRRIAKRVFQENKARQIFLEMKGPGNVSFSENSVCFVFFVTPVLRFAFLPYYQQFSFYSNCNNNILTARRILVFLAKKYLFLN